LIAWFGNLNKANVQGRGYWFKFRLFPLGMIICIVHVFLNLISVGHISLKILYIIVGLNKIIYDYDNGVGLADDIRVIYGKLF
jgi:hypothetical protein